MIKLLLMWKKTKLYCQVSLLISDSLRYYNYDVYFSHILGYIRKISDKEYEAN